jgi:DNA-binding XRE family transcriptional regulator
MKNRLRELRAAKEWSQGDLADKLGVSTPDRERH